jgi:hypothetical protein
LRFNPETDLAVGDGLTKTVQANRGSGKGNSNILSPYFGNHQWRTKVNSKARPFSLAILVAVSFLLVSRHAGTTGEKDQKLPPAVGKIELKDGKGEIKGALAASDPKDASRKECYCKIYTIKLEAGKSYQFDCTSNWDNWLRLEDAKGKQLAEDDDSGGGTNAQIVFECKTAGEYRVIVTSFDAADTGDFTVTAAQK